MRKWVSIYCCVAAVTILAACGPKSMVVLVPDTDGSVGQITVSNSAGSVDINRANQSTTIRGVNAAPDKPRQLDSAEVEKEFAAVISRQPPPAVHFKLYFRSASVKLQSLSSHQMPEIIATIQQRMPTRISVVGHSDTQGDKNYNLDLSLRRARAVKKQLLDEGIDAAFIEVSSHGEENPLINTGDNVANAKNRRVEVVVR